MSRRLRPDERVGGLALNSSRAWRCPGEVMGQWAPDLLGHASEGKIIREHQRYKRRHP